jgi:hypothetical protein
MKRAIVTLAGLAIAGMSLTACGTTAATPAIRVTVTAPGTTAAAPTTAAPSASPSPSASSPQIVINNNPAPAPARTVYVQPPAYEPAEPQLTDCNGGTYEGDTIWAGSDTSCPFALNVAGNYTGTGADYAYSPVTGLWYDMTCEYPSTDGSVACYGGNNAYAVVGPDELGNLTTRGKEMALANPDQSPPWSCSALAGSSGRRIKEEGRAGYSPETSTEATIRGTRTSDCESAQVEGRFRAWRVTHIPVLAGIVPKKRGFRVGAGGERSGGGT